MILAYKSKKYLSIYRSYLIVKILIFVSGTLKTVALNKNIICVISMDMEVLRDCELTICEL